MKTKRVLAFCSIIFIAVMVIGLLPVHGEWRIYDEVIRLHVLANSDSDEDQALKLKVRDCVISEVEGLIGGISDREAALDVLSKEEKAAFTLRSLYANYGYSQYKMSKFEEYDLYVKNKDFLVSESVITFTDTDGKLMALKPDVTLSIIKNSKDLEGKVMKVSFVETNVKSKKEKTKTLIDEL
mgnify:CR=1 FL=1